jgi:hypothetical protein
MIYGLPGLKDRINQGNQGNQINPGSDIILPDYFVFLLQFRKNKLGLRH